MRSTSSETSLVEEIPDLHADGPVRDRLRPLLHPTGLPQLWLLPVCEPHSDVQWDPLLVPFPQLLQEILQGKETKET